MQNVTSNPKKTTVLNMNRQEKQLDSQPFTKLKEVFCLRTCRHKNTTFNFAQPHLTKFVADKLTINTNGLNFDK